VSTGFGTTWPQASANEGRGIRANEEGDGDGEGTPTHPMYTTTTPCHLAIRDATSIDVRSAVARLQGGRSMGVGVVSTFPYLCPILSVSFCFMYIILHI
jgi:hypothetical protein